MSYPQYKVHTRGIFGIKFTGIKETDKYGIGITVWGKGSPYKINEEYSGWTPPNGSIWRNPNTIEEWFKFLPAGYDELALKALSETKDGWYDHEKEFKDIDSPARAIQLGFRWGDAKEGRSFWQSVFYALKNNTSLPTLPAKVKENPVEKIMNPEKKRCVYTKYSPGLAAYAEEVVKRKTGCHWTVSHDPKSLFINFQKNGSPIGTIGEVRWDARYTEVSAAEFIAELESWPEKKKEFVGKLNELNLKVTSESVTIGCQEYSKEEFRMIEKTVEAAREERIIRIEGHPDITVQGERIISDGHSFSFEQFDIVSKKVQELS